MLHQNETSLTPSQIHFLRSLLDGKREITEFEAQVRRKKLALQDLVLPCAIVCISPYFTNIRFEKKDELISNCSDYVCRLLEKAEYKYYCITNSYDNIQIILPTEANGFTTQILNDFFIKMHQRFNRHFDLELFIGIGSIVDLYSEISRSALEAMEMLAFKNQYADRGVINIVNTSRFRHYSLYGEDIMFARVLGRFQDGDLGMMAIRLDELIESIRRRPGVSTSAIRRTVIELAVNILHIASNANVDVDSILNGQDIYNWVLKQTHTEVLTEWLLELSGKLLAKMEIQQETEEKQIIKQACDYVASHLNDPSLSLQSVSDAVGLSGAYFSQLFKTEKGIGLNNYISESRIVQAKELLKMTDLKNADIALQLGFTTPTYFGQVFKKSTGMTPSDYRKQIKQAENL